MFWGERPHRQQISEGAIPWVKVLLVASGPAPRVNGLWRSLVAHLTGGQGVVGSNPASPTTGTHIQILGLSPKREIMFENNDSFSRGVCLHGVILRIQSCKIIFK